MVALDRSPLSCLTLVILASALGCDKRDCDAALAQAQAAIDADDAARAKTSLATMEWSCSGSQLAQARGSIEAFEKDGKRLELVADRSRRLREQLAAVDELQQAVELGTNDDGPLTLCTPARDEAVARVNRRLDRHFQVMHGSSVEAQLNTKMMQTVGATRSCLGDCKGHDCTEALTRQDETRTFLRDQIAQLEQEESTLRRRKAAYRVTTDRAPSLRESQMAPAPAAR